MRLRDIKKILDDNLEHLELNYEYRENNTKALLTGFQKTLKALDNLTVLNFLEKDLAAIQNVYLMYGYRSQNDKQVVEVSTFNTFNTQLQHIKLKCQATSAAIEEALPEQEELSISVKLPKYNDLSELASFFHDLNKVLNQTLVNDYLKGNVKLNSFDSGSYWVEIAIGSMVGLKFVAHLVKSAAVIRKELLQGDILKQQLTQLKRFNEGIDTEAIEQAHKQQIKEIVKAEVANLINNNDNIDKTDNEFASRLGHSLEILGELIKKGTEIHHSLNAPEEITKLFPNYEELNLIESEIMKIGPGPAAIDEIETSNQN